MIGQKLMESVASKEKPGIHDPSVRKELGSDCFRSHHIAIYVTLSRRKNDRIHLFVASLDTDMRSESERW